MSENITQLQERIFKQNLEMGWHDTPREIGTLLMLVVSEVAEAMEGARKGLMDNHLPNRRMLEVELADAVIRILDIGGLHNLDIEGAIMEKVEYNKNREDHQRSNREKEGGKKW